MSLYAHATLDHQRMDNHADGFVMARKACSLYHLDYLHHGDNGIVHMELGNIINIFICK